MYWFTGCRRLPAAHPMPWTALTATVWPEVSWRLGIESKEQLKSYRWDKFMGLMLKNNINIMQQSFWTEAEKAKEAELWAIADAEYEANKIALANILNSLSPEDLELYYKEIG